MASTDGDVLSQLIHNAPVGIVLVDAEFRLTQASAGCGRLFGGVEMPPGSDFAEILRIIWPEPFATEAIDRFQHTLATGERGSVSGAESQHWQIDRIALPLGRPVIVGYFSEMTHRETARLHRVNLALEHKLREEQMAQIRIAGLVKQLVTIQEEERHRVAREIHDQLGQPMTALRMHLELLQVRSGTPAADEVLESSRRLTQDLDRSIDFLTWQLRPSVIEDLGISDAIANLVSTWSQQFQIDARYEADGVDDLRLSTDIETHLYRIAQEALHNVYKHARAHHVAVRLATSNGKLVLTVADDGCGLGSDRDVFAAGMGLSNMRDRAVLAAGELFVFWSSGGTTVELRLPNPQAD